MTSAKSVTSEEFVRGSVLCAARSCYEFHRVTYTEWGRSGTRGTVICVHGLTRQGRDFDFLARALAADGYRVICPDIVGRGLSDHLSNAMDYDLPQYVMDMTTLLALLKVDEVNWIGFSMGGQIGLILAGMANSPIGRLLVNDIGPHLPVSAVLRIGRYVRSGPRRFATEDDVDKYFRDILSPFGNLTAAQWRHIAEHSVMPHEEGGYRFRFDRKIVRGFRPPWNFAEQLWRLWDQIACPTLILRGVDTDLLLSSTAEEMLARNAQARLLEIADCGHLPPLMDADQIRLVSDWLNGKKVGCAANEAETAGEPAQPRATARRVTA
jgi:pimeloyl-ACP methyl ester carboxylesterase